MLMTCHYPDLGSVSDWSCREGNLLQPIRSTTQICVVTRHQYGISALISQTIFRGEHKSLIGNNLPDTLSLSLGYPVPGVQMVGSELNRTRRAQYVEHDGKKKKRGELIFCPLPTI